MRRRRSTPTDPPLDEAAPPQRVATFKCVAGSDVGVQVRDPPPDVARACGSQKD